MRENVPRTCASVRERDRIDGGTGAKAEPGERLYRFPCLRRREVHRQIGAGGQTGEAMQDGREAADDDVAERGTTLLTMKVRGAAELSSWILSQAPWVRVLRPAGLRDEVARRLREGAKLYEARSGSAAQSDRTR